MAQSIRTYTYQLYVPRVGWQTVGTGLSADDRRSIELRPTTRGFRRLFTPEDSPEAS